MGQKKVLRMGHFKLTLVSCLVYINWWWSKPKLFILGYLSMYFSWKYGLHMGQHVFRKMSFQTLKTWIKKITRILSILSCPISSSLNKRITVCDKIRRWPPYNSLLILWITILLKMITYYRIVSRLTSSLIRILYWSDTCCIPTETRVNSLWSEADPNFAIPERKMYYTFKKGENMKWPFATCIFWQILVMYEPVFP
jgi:hypothetical protein